MNPLRRVVSAATRWARSSRYALRNDSGMALIGVIFLGGALVIMSATVMARGNAQFTSTQGDRHWEDALAAAEAGLNWGLAVLDGNTEWNTADMVPVEVFGAPGEREWAISIADDKDGAFVVPTPVGDFVVVKPLNATAVYAVGFAPSRDAVERRVRVVRAGYELVPTELDWITNLAVITEDALEVIGNPSFYTGMAIGIHTNGFLKVGGSMSLDGCLSASSGWSQEGSSVTQGVHCPTPGTQPRMPLPEIDGRDRWRTSTHDLCPDGRVRAGPNHATLGFDHTDAEPCTGSVIVENAAATPFSGWSFHTSGIAWRQTAKSPIDGVFYVHQNSVLVESNPGSSAIPWLATIIATTSGECPSAVRGDIVIAGHPTFDPYPDTGNLLMVADRDVLISGNPNMSGIIASGEQIAITGNATVTLGTYVTASVCHTPGSPVAANYISGNASVHNLTDVETDLTVWVDLLNLVHWAELRS